MSQEKKNQPPKGPDFTPVPPVQLFDDYFFVGNKVVGIHILKTSEGLVLFDSSGSTDTDETMLIPGLKELGLENEKIVMLFLSHGHFDHYLGAEVIRLRTGCDVALSKEDTAYMSYSRENWGQDPLIPRVTRYIQDGETISFGDHSVYVMSAPGHTPGCLNFSFTVHDHGEPHRVIMMGGYGVFGPNAFLGGGEYPYGVTWAVDQALVFASSCVKTWEYCKENHCDVYLNPHPHLCSLLEQAEQNKTRADGAPNAHVIGTDGVRKWILERYEVCLESAQKFTDIRETYQ